MSDDAVGIAVAQFSPIAGDNLPAVQELATKAAHRGARVVLFPEYTSYFSDPFDATLVTHAETLDGPFISGVRALASRLGITIVVGLLEAAGEGRVHNTAVAVGPGGPLAVYRKQHLYDAFGQKESDWVAPGDIIEPQTFEVHGVTFGMQTCYDLRFPEITRTIVDAGAQVVLVPAEWVRGPLKEHHWRTLIHARAIENTVYVAAADHTPPLGVGNSMIVDPSGVEIAAIGAERRVAVADVTPRLISAVRERNPSLQARRYRVVPR